MIYSISEIKETRRQQCNNVISQSEINNVTMKRDLDKYTRNGKHADIIATQLTEKFGSPSSYKFYCKVALVLSEGKVWDLFEQAQKGKSPARLFNYLCNKEMER